jgi:iron complex outermembrane receptor protein
MELTDPWQAQNIQDVTTKGFETQLLYSFNLNAFAQKLQFGYSFIQNDIKESTFALTVFFEFTKASVCGSYNMQFLKNFTNTISYRYAERIAGDSYSVVDLGASFYMLLSCLCLLTIFSIQSIQKRI